MEEITNKQLYEKLTAIENLVLSQHKYSGIDEKSVVLWTMRDIAEYCQFTVRQVQTMITAPYFPKPVRVPSQRDPNVPSKRVRWFAGEVVRYMRRRQGV